LPCTWTRYSVMENMISLGGASGPTNLGDMSRLAGLSTRIAQMGSSQRITWCQSFVHGCAQWETWLSCPATNWRVPQIWPASILFPFAWASLNPRDLPWRQPWSSTSSSHTNTYQCKHGYI
jgi:hypothetical protein